MVNDTHMNIQIHTMFSIVCSHYTVSREIPSFPHTHTRHTAVCQRETCNLGVQFQLKGFPVIWGQKGFNPIPH